MDAKDRGKTLWEMLQARLHGGGNGAGLVFANPLDLRVGSAVPIAYANGPEFAQCDFTAFEIREYNRHIGAQDFRFTDYVLRGVSAKTLDSADEKLVRIRVVPNLAGSQDSLLLYVYDEFAFAEDFLSVVKDDTGVFEASAEGAAQPDTFHRINDLRESYVAAVLVVSETTADGKAAPGKAAAARVEYWDYWRDLDLDGGKIAKEFLFVEMNSDTGWFQIWRGKEFYS